MVCYEMYSRRTDITTPTVYLPMIESSLGIVGACLPLMKPILTEPRNRSIFSSIRTLISLNRTNEGEKQSEGYSDIEAGKTVMRRGLTVTHSTISLK